MRNLFLGAAAIMAIAAPSVAAAQTGYVGADYTSTDIDGLGSEDAFGVSGAVELSGHVAIDAGVFDNDGESAWGGAGHLYLNDSSHLIGAFLTVSDSDASTLWGGGVEGQVYLNNVTLAGAVSYGRDDDADVDAMGANGEARYFFSDNFRVEGGLGFFNIDTAGGDDNATTFSAGGEYQFAAAPVSVGLGYTRLALDEADIDADTVSATVRWNFGGGTLHGRDHTGAALAGLSGIGSALGL